MRSHADDIQLVQAALGGAGEAREELGRRLGCVAAIVASLDRCRGERLGREDRLDLAQEVQLLLWARLGTYTGAVPLEAWARGYCVNLHRNAVRKQTRRAWRRVEPDTEILGAGAPAGGPEHDELWAALARLEPGEVRAVRMKCLDELTFAEIAARLRLAPGTAKTCYYRALRRLAARLARAAGPGERTRLPPRARKCETPRRLGDNHAPAGSPSSSDDENGRPRREAR